MNTTIFKAYDIRGVAPEDFSPDIPERVALAVLRETGAKRVVLGADARATSPEFKRRVLETLLVAGADVVDIGLCTTPMFNYSVASDASIDAGIMVTASHNPAKYNGFKMVSSGARPISGKRIGELVGAASAPAEGSRGSVEVRDVIPGYLDAILKLAQWTKEDAAACPPIVIDAGNGMVGIPLRAFLERTGIRAMALYAEVDCSFPNHEANPVHEATLEVLKKQVVEQSAAFGVAFDGDADRIGFVDEKGIRIAGDHMGALIAEELLRTYPGSHILGDTNAGWAFREAVERAGGSFELTPVGHANIKERMRVGSALFAAELSYHFYYREFFNVESTLLTLLIVLKRHVREGKSMSELVAPYRAYVASGEINFEVKDASTVLARVRAEFEKDASRVFDVDGLRLEFADYWFSLRASNTEPLLRLNVEGKSNDRVEATIERIKKMIS